MSALFLMIWTWAGLALAGGTTQHPPGLQRAPVISLAHVPASATHRPAGDASRRHPVEAKLLIDSTHAVPGQPIRVGVHLSQDPGWHTYWKSPGHIGLPTEIRWTVPEGTQSSPVQFPVPSRFELEGIVSFGYDGQVLLFTELIVPAGLGAGPFEVSAEVNWLVCEILCIQGSATLKRTVNLSTEPAQPSPSRSLFDAFAAQLPRPMSDFPGIEVSASFSPASVPVEGTFAVDIVVSGEGLQPQGSGLWPSFTPIVSGADWGPAPNVDGNAALPQIQAAPGAMKVVQKGMTFGAAQISGEDAYGGLVMAKLNGEWVHFELSTPIPIGKAAPSAASTAPVIVQPDAQPAGPSASIGTMLFFAFIGGLILNIMPCVLPVLSLKIYSVIEQQDATSRERHVAGLAYTAGVVLSFLALAGAIIVARSMFDITLGWGEQFQSPAFIIVLCSVVFVFGLSLFGVFEVPSFGATQLSGAQNKEGWVGHLLTGAFATVLATPCSAPFLGTGIGFAMSLPPAGLLGFFAVAGLGLALPFLLVSYVPALAGFLPKPGAWMETFKQLMGFTLMATTVWLLDALGAQVGTDGVFGFLVFLTALAFACWIVGRWAGPIASTRSKLLALALAVGISAWVGQQWLVFEATVEDEVVTGGVPETLDYSHEIPWIPFSEERVEGLAGRPIFIDFTAAWCLSCKANEKTILSTDTVRQAMADNKIVPLMADNTKKSPIIRKWLDRYQKAGVPMYLVIPADRSQPVKVLPEILTIGIVVDALNEI
jgi:thiol:disulfide interchange protein/DsbC/DsbD-like thiol-disulfide interchange protein